MDTLLGILHMIIFPGGIFALVLGFFFKGLDRRVVARLQRRVGPPLAQPWYDTAKFLTKETLIPKTACRTAFLYAPVVGFTGMAVCAAFMPVPGVFNGLFNMDFGYAKETFVWKDGDTADRVLEIPTFHVDGATYPRSFRVKLSAQTTGDYANCETPDIFNPKVVIGLVEE